MENIMNWISDPQAWLALGTLTALEIVLGIDNIIFIAILSSRLPKEKQDLARKVGLLLAMITRIGLLFCLTLIMRFSKPIFTILDNAISGRDIILILGGLFLLVKATLEIHHKLEGQDDETRKKFSNSFTNVIIQIMLLDIVFSLDSIITAIGLANQLAIMVISAVRSAHPQIDTASFC